MVSNFVFAVAGIFLIWISLLTFFLWRTITHYNKLSKGVTDKSLKTVLEDLLKEASMVRADIGNLKTHADKIQKEGLFHIQKIGLVRFNPFKDTGGDQSFILSLIDGNDTGVIISGLYSRSGTRWYAKKVVAGKGVEYELSDDEKKALKEAKVVN